MSERISKAELHVWAKMLDSVATFHVGAQLVNGLRFSADGTDVLTAAELEARIRTADPELADRFHAWHDATSRLGAYVHRRLNEGPQDS